MSKTDTAASFRSPRPELPAEPKVKEPDGYLSVLAGGKSPISMPPIPAWMLNTPMYSKLPMIPAPKGKITLYTTGLGEKLYQSPSDLEFDPSAEGLNSQYRCLHDPHLKTHYNQSASFKELVKKKFITQEGKVVCTLKEFNEYHQYLKRIHIEKLAHGRKRTAERERRDRERQRQEWSHREELSPHDKHLVDVQIRRRKLLKEQHQCLTQRLEEDAMKHLRLLKEMQAKHCIEEARGKLERETKRNKKIRMEMEELIKRAKKRKKQTEDERKHAELLKCYRMGLKDRRQLKLEDQWNRHKRIRDKRLVDDSKRKKQSEAQIEQNIRTREEVVADQRARQLSTFQHIRDTGAAQLQQQEAKIRARLEKKLKIVRDLLEQRRQRQTGGRRRRHHARHGLGGPRHYSTWAVDYALERIKLSPADGVWKFDERMLLMNIPTTSPVTSVPIEPTLASETKDAPHTVISGSKDILEEVDEDDLDTEITEDQAFSLSSLELAVLFGDHYDSFITSSRDLVGNIFHALEAERFSSDSITTHEPGAAGSEVKLPDVIRRKSVLHLSNSRVARLVVSTILNGAKEQVVAEGGLPPLPGSTATASDSMLPSATEISTVGRQISLPEVHPASPIAKSEVMSDGSLQQPRGKGKSSSHTSSSLLARAVVADAIRNVVQELEAEETQRSDTSILAEEVVWDAIRSVTSQLHSELSRSGTSVIAERVVSDAIREAARQLREESPMHSSTSLLAEDLAYTAIKNATKQLRVLLPQSSSSIIAEAVAADAIKNVMRQLGADPLRSSSSIIAQALASDALKNATRHLETEQTLHALHPQVHTSSSLLAQAVTNNSLQKATRQLQQENRALQPHTDSSLMAESVTNDALANAVRHLEKSSKLAQAVTCDTLKNATAQLQAEKRLHTPQTSSDILAQEVTQPHKASSSQLAQGIADDVLKTAKEQLQTEQRVSSRCKSRGSRSSSPFSPEFAQSAMNQTSPQPAQCSLKARAVVSDIIKRTAESPSPTEGGLRTPPPSPVDHSVQPLKDPLIDREVDAPFGSEPRREETDIAVQAQIAVKLVFSSVIAYLNQAKEYPRDEDMIHLSQSEGKVHDGHDVHLHRSSILLATVNDVFRESETDLAHHDHVQGSESGESNLDGEDDDEADEIIGLVENEIIAEEESVHSLAECLEGLPVEGLTSVVKRNQEKTIFEGAVIPREGAHDESVTEKVLSVEELHADKSGHLVHDVSNKSIHRVAESGEYSEDGHREEGAEAKSHHFSSIVPIYHNHPLNLDEEIISHNLSAISMKPDSHRKMPSAYSANSRNSFRNVFRPDMTFCQGSAKCLKDTLVQELSHPHHDEHDHIYGVLDQPDVDITEHHSDEEFMGTEETGGVCYLPQRKAYKVHEVLDDVVTEEQEQEEQSNTARADEEDIQHGTSQDHKDTVAGGDCTSPHEDEVEPTVPVSRVSTRSVRSGKSRDTPCLGRESESRRGGSPAEVVSHTETKTTDDGQPSGKASHSRSMIGAVISRISSIFSRKHSKMHTESKGKKGSTGASSSSTHSQDQGSAPKTEGSKTGESLHITDVSAQDLNTVNQVNVLALESTGTTEDTTTASYDTKGDEENPILSKQQTEDADETNLRTNEDTSQKVKQGEIDAVQPEAKEQENPPRGGPSLPEKIDKAPATLMTVDDKSIVEKKVKSKVKMEATKDDVNEETEEPGRSKSKTLPKMDEEPARTTAVRAEVKPNLTRNKSSFEKRQRGKKKKSKSGSDPCIKRTISGRSVKSKPFLSLTRTLSRSSTKSSSPLDGFRRQQSPRKSPISPRPKEAIPSKPSERRSQNSGSKKTIGHVKIPSSTKPTAESSETAAVKQPSADTDISSTMKQSSTHLSSQPMIKQRSAESSAPTVMKQRSQVSKPPSTGSVRLIKVTPAPSMSSRSGKHSSAGSLKRISGHTSGGSVRLINVSPAASTAIGPRRTSQQSTGSGAKTSPAPSPSETSGRVQRLQSRTASSVGITDSHENPVCLESTSHQKHEEARRQSPVTREVEKQTSAGSFVLIRTPTEMPNDQTVSGVSSGFVEVSADLGAPADLKGQPVGQALPGDESIHGSRPDDEGSFKKAQSPDEEKKPAAPIHEAAEVQSDPRVENQSQELSGVMPGEDNTSGPASVDDQAPPHTGRTQEDRQQPGDDDEVSTGQAAVVASRSKRVISAVIDRLSRMFSGQSVGSGTTGKGSHPRSETPATAAKSTAVKSEYVIRQGEGGLHQSRSTGTAPTAPGSAEPVLSSKRKRKHKNKGKRTSSSEGGSKTNAHAGGTHFPVPPNSSASDANSTASVTPATTAQISTVNSTNLPPVEAVETTAQPPTECEVIPPEDSPDDN